MPCALPAFASHYLAEIGDTFLKLDKRHKWAEHEDGELVFYQCVVCGEKRTETVLASQLRQSIELIRNSVQY
jgi:hypothetical protein